MTQISFAGIYICSRGGVGMSPVRHGGFIRCWGLGEGVDEERKPFAELIIEVLDVPGVDLFCCIDAGVSERLTYVFDGDVLF